MRIATALLCSLFLVIDPVVCQVSETAPKRVLISPKHPVDSLGETVYENQGKDDVDVPVVPGLVGEPKPLRAPAPKYSKALKKARYEGDITIFGVVTSTGQVIDLETSPLDDAEAASCAVEAVKLYRFSPSTLDGKPVAIRFRAIVHFRLHKS